MKNGQEILFRGKTNGGSFKPNAIFLEEKGMLCGDLVYKIKHHGEEWLVKSHEVKTEGDVARDWKNEMIKAAPCKSKKEMADKLKISVTCLNKRLAFCAIDFNGLKPKK